MMSAYDHPASRAAERHGIEAEKAERRHDLRGKHYFNHLAAECEAEAARAATDTQHKALIWTSTVAYAYHANDPVFFQRRAAEALSSSNNELMKAQIIEMLADPMPTLESNRRPSPRMQPSTVLPFSGFLAKRAALLRRVATQPPPKTH